MNEYERRYSDQRKAEEEETAYAERATRIREHGEAAGFAYGEGNGADPWFAVALGIAQGDHTTPSLNAAGDHADVELNP